MKSESIIVLRWAGALAALVGIFISFPLTVMFSGVVHCSLPEMINSTWGSDCRNQMMLVLVLILVNFTGAACVVGNIFAKRRGIGILAGVAGVLYGLFLGWFLLFGMAGMFGGGAY